MSDLRAFGDEVPGGGQAEAAAASGDESDFSVDAMCDSTRPPGCLAVQAAARCGDATSPIGRKLITFCDGSRQAFVERFKRAKAEGDLPKDADPATLARYISTVAQGISIQAASGASRAELRRVVEMALRQWPK